jgi:hypothetical protein
MADVNTAMTSWRGNAEHAQAAMLAKAVDLLVECLGTALAAGGAGSAPLIEKHITASEWNQLGAEGGASTPADMRPVAFGMMMYEGGPVVIRDMLSNMPPQVASVLSDLAPRAYAEYSRKIHGTHPASHHCGLSIPPRPAGSSGSSSHPPAGLGSSSVAAAGCTPRRSEIVETASRTRQGAVHTMSAFRP